METSHPAADNNRNPKPVVSPVKNENNIQQQTNTNDNKETVENKKSVSGLLDKLKNIKLKKPSFASGLKMPKASAGGANNLKSKLDNFFKSKTRKIFCTRRRNTWSRNNK